MANETLARRYATAVFSLAGEQGSTERVGNDLASIAQTINQSSDARDFFVAPTIDRSDKERALTVAFEGKVHELALHSLLLLVRKRREAILDALVAEYRKLELRARGAEALTVTSARQLPANELDAIVARLQQVYGKKFEVKQVVDPHLIGGVRILMGDRRIDGSVSGRLEALARELFAGANG